MMHSNSILQTTLHIITFVAFKIVTRTSLTNLVLIRFKTWRDCDFYILEFENHQFNVE